MTKESSLKNSDEKSTEDFKEALAAAKTSLRSGQFDQVIIDTKKILSASPVHMEALYLRAVAERYDNRFSAALKTLAKLKSVAPEYGRALQEEGHIFRAQGDLERAVRYYHQACIYNPGLEASWKAQEEIFSKLGRQSEALNAKGFYERLKALPRSLHTATNLLHEGKLVQAEHVCKQYMIRDPRNVEGMRLLADIANRLGANDEAEFLYETALELQPKNVSVLMDFVSFLKSVQKPEKALIHAEFLDATYPGNPMLQSIHAIQSLQIGDYETAMGLFDSVLQKVPNDPITLTSKGHALKTKGDQEEAISCYRQAFKIKPDHGEAYFSLANLKTYKFLDSEVRQMEQVLRSDELTLQNRASLNFSLGKAFEDKKDFGKAFIYYDQGNENKRFLSRYDAGRMTDDLQAQIDACTPELFTEKKELGHAAPDPIFILGLPRAGSTLLEQILASHSQIDGTLELPNILTLASKLTRKSQGTDKEYPKNLHDLSKEQLEEFGRTFIEETRIHRKNAPFFIDKMPNNFRHIGLIHLILPNAKIIDARRHPMACCFSGFKQLFAEGQEFTYGLEQIGNYYRDYVNLMDHWDKVLPGKILRIQYEDVVADTESQVRCMLEYLDLSFEQECVDFHETDRSVRTASSEQVRQPIFKSGLEQWRNFEPWLDPLKEALGSVLARYPID